jgi:hypothetical protein
MRFYSVQQYADAVRSAQATYTWPADRRPDIEKVISDSAPPEGGQAQAGLEHIVLSIVHACAWYLSWSDAVRRNQPDRAGKALSTLSAGLPVAKIDPSTAEATKEIVARAQAGDTAPAINYVQANCDNVRWLAPSE